MIIGMSHFIHHIIPVYFNPLKALTFIFEDKVGLSLHLFLGEDPDLYGVSGRGEERSVAFLSGTEGKCRPHRLLLDDSVHVTHLEEKTRNGVRM